MSPYASILLIWYWGANEPELHISAGVEAEHCETRTSYDVTPLVLTWTPEDGFGYQSRAAVTVARNIYCDE